MDIEKIKEKEYNIKEALKQHFEDEIASDIGICSYLIFPDGTLIGGYAHRDFFDYLIDEGVLTTEEVGEYDTDIFNTLFNCVRCTDLENENYIGLPTNRLTEEQFKALKEWLENNFELGRKEILVTANFKKENEAGVTYNYAKIVEDGDWPSDYIINRIKRYYSSGKLVEDIEAEVAEDAIVDKIKSLLPKYGHPVFFDDNNNLMIDKALSALSDFMSDQWSVWVSDEVVYIGSLSEMLDKFLELVNRFIYNRIELCVGNVDGLVHTYLVHDPDNLREDIEDDTDNDIDNICVTTRQEPSTAKLTSQIPVLDLRNDLKLLKIPSEINGVPIYDVEGFHTLTNLETVIFPDTVVKINYGAFADCEKLKNIKWPANLTRIEKSAFKNTGLTEVILPKSCSRVSSKAFKNCEKLEAVTFNGNCEVTWEDNVFAGCNSLKSIRFKKDFWLSVAEYSVIESWLGNTFTGNKASKEISLIFEKNLTHKSAIKALKMIAQKHSNIHISGPDFDNALEEDIEEVEYDGVLTPSEEENYTWKLGLEQLIVLKDWQDKYYSFAKGPGVYRLNYDAISRKLEGARLDDFVIREISLVREYYHYSKEYSTIRYILNIDDVVSDDTHYFTLVSLDVDNLAAILCKWDEPEHTPHIQASFDKLVSICKLEEMLGLGDFTKNKMEEMVKCFKNGAEEITEDVEETAYEDEPIYCVTISVGTDETVMCYLLNEELKLRLINNGLLDGYYIDEMGMGNLLAVDWLYFVSSTPETSVMHNQIIIPALQTGTVGQRNLLLYMKPEQLRFVTQFPRKLITHWPMNEDIEEEPYDDKFMSLINLQVISDYAADYTDGGGWIWRDFGIIVEDNPMGGPYIAGIFKATDDPNKFIRYDLDSIPEDILSDKELSYMNPEETDIDEYVPNLMYALESKDNRTITDIINRIEANASQETVTLKAALNFIDAYWGTDEELDSWIEDAQKFHLNNANYLNIVEKLNEDIEEEPYSDSGASADVTLIKTAYDTRNDERYWIWEMPADVLCDISNKYDTHNYRRLDQRIWDFKSLAADPDYSWRIKRVVTDEGSHYTSNHRLISIADISYQYYGYCKPDHETLTDRYALLPYLRFSTGKQFDEEDLATLDKIRELDALLGVPEKYGIDNLIEQINGGSLDLYEDVNEEPIDIDTSSDNIIAVTKFRSYWGKYKYRSIYYDINLDKTELVDYLLDLYMGLQVEKGQPEEDIEEDIKLIRNRVKDCILYIDYKPEDNYSLGIYQPDYNNTLGIVKMPKDIAEKIIGDKLVTDNLEEDIEEVPPTEKDFLPEYSSKYLNWDKNTEGRKKSIEIINNHWNEKIWFLTVGGREADVYTPRRYMTFGEAYNDFVTYDKFADTDYLDNFIALNVKGFVLSPSELQKRYSCILFRACNEPEYVPDMSVSDINEDIEEIPQQYDVDIDPINNRDIYSIFNNYPSCDCNEDVKTIVTRDRDKKRWYVKYYADLWDDGEIITRELLTFDEAFKIFSEVPLDNSANSYALILTKLTEEEKRIIKRGNTIEPFYITNDRFDKYLRYIEEI